MLQAIRDRATGWIAYGIIGLLIIPFAFFGIDQFQGGGQVDVAEVDGNEITLQEFQRAYQEQQARLQNLLGGQFDPSMLDETRLKRDVLQQLVDQRLMVAIAAGEGYRVGDRQIAETIRSIPAFQNAGAFDDERYRLALRRQGLVPAAFEEQLRAEISTEQMSRGISTTYRPTRAELNALLEVMEQTREVGFLRLSLDSFRQSVEVSDSDLESWFDDNRDRFRAPERVRVQYVELDAGRMAEQSPVSDDELRGEYEAQIARFTRDEERTASYVLVPVAADASEDDIISAGQRIDDIHQQLRDDAFGFDDAMALAADDSDGTLEAGELGVVAPGMLEPAIEQALFALDEVGGFTEPVRSQFGFHIIHLDKMTPGETRSFDEVRDELRAEIQKRRAETEFFEQAETLSNISYEEPGSLEPVAEALALTISESTWMTPSQGEGIGEQAAIRTAAFSDDILRQGLNSEAVELGPAQLVVLRLLEHEEARPREFPEVRSEVEDAVRNERAEQEMNRVVEQTLSAMKAGRDTLESYATPERDIWNPPVAVKRTGSELPPGVIDEAFRMPRPGDGKPVYSAPVLGNGDRAVIELVAVNNADPDSVSEESRQRLSAQIAQQSGANEWQSSLQSLRSRSDIKTHPDRL